MALEQELRDFSGPWVTAWNSHDLDALDALVTEDVTWDDPAMRGETVHGRAEFKAFAETFFRAFPDVQVESIGDPYLRLDGSGFAVRSRMTGTFAGELTLWTKPPGKLPAIEPTGRSFDTKAVDLYELRDGRVSDWTLVYDLASFAQQIGLMP